MLATQACFCSPPSAARGLVPPKGLVISPACQPGGSRSCVCPRGQRLLSLLLYTAVAMAGFSVDSGLGVPGSCGGQASPTPVTSFQSSLSPWIPGVCPSASGFQRRALPGSALRDRWKVGGIATQEAESQEVQGGATCGPFHSFMRARLRLGGLSSPRTGSSLTGENTKDRT